MTGNRPPISKPDDTRREFFRDSSLWLASALPAASTARAQATKSVPRRIGLLGCNRTGQRVLRDVLQRDPSTQLVSLADFLPEHLQQTARSSKGRFRGQYAVGHADRLVGTDIARLWLPSNPYKLDLLIIALPPALRACSVRKARQSGISVLAAAPLDVCPSACITQLPSAGAVGHQGCLSLAWLLITDNIASNLARLHRQELGCVQHVHVGISHGLPSQQQIRQTSTRQTAPYTEQLRRLIDTLFDSAAVSPLNATKCLSKSNIDFSWMRDPQAHQALHGNLALEHCVTGLAIVEQLLGPCQPSRNGVSTAPAVVEFRSADGRLATVEYCVPTTGNSKPSPSPKLNIRCQTQRGTFDLAGNQIRRCVDQSATRRTAPQALSHANQLQAATQPEPNTALLQCQQTQYRLLANTQWVLRQSNSAADRSPAGDSA